MSILHHARHLWRPKDPFRLAVLRRRWQHLPQALKSADQAIGRYVVGCGATHGVNERCNFGCTACYLGVAANRQAPMPFDRVLAQLQQLRDYLGPGGNVQITSGEVTLLPVEALTRIVRAAVDLELSPMVMTHGDVFLHDPKYLNQLVTEGGLRKVSIHVDTTQRGRRGLAMPRSERELNAVRDRFADLLRASRARTGHKLKAAMTLTVNRDNLDQLPDAITWYLDHLDCFRIMSFQPQARTGRTKADNGVGAADVWRKLEQTLGRRLNGHPFKFGHEACTRFSLLLCLELHQGRILLEAVREGNAMDQGMVQRVLADFAGLVAGDRGPWEIAAKVMGTCLRKPVWFGWLAAYVARRSWQERKHIPAVLAAMVRGKLRIRPFAFVVHAFMNRDELATDLGKERLAGCVFKLAVDGRMVSMCEMNATELRESTYD